MRRTSRRAAGGGISPGRVIPWVLLLVCGVLALEKRERGMGLNKTISSSTIGRGNMSLSLYGRAFLWDNQAAEKIPTMLPHAEVGYGLNDFLQLSGGLQIMTTRPSLGFIKFKATTPNTKNIRFLGIGQTVELYKNLISEFKSNGYRYNNEGFSPDFFMIGNNKLITYYRFISSMDVEMIKISSYLPFKYYLNVGFEGGLNWDCIGKGTDCWFPEDGKGISWMGDHLKEARAHYHTPDLSDAEVSGSANFQKIPVCLGAELKTLSTDFFLELEAEPFLESVVKLIGHWSEKDKLWTRFNVVLAGDPPTLKVFDLHFLENPVYINGGARIKYPNGMSLQGGASWLLSMDFGPKLGPCKIYSGCKEGASDGFSPFYPQWRLFGQLNYPIKFRQTSAELYRTYLLRKNRNIRKVIDIDEDLEKTGTVQEKELPVEGAGNAESQDQAKKEP